MGETKINDFVDGFANVNGTRKCNFCKLMLC